MTLLRRRTELTHRTKDDYPLPSATSSFEQLDGGACRSRIRVVGVVDERHVTHLFPRRAHLRLRHCRDSFRDVGIAHSALPRDRESEHRVAQVMQATNGRSDDYAVDLDRPESVSSDFPAVWSEISILIEAGHYNPLCFAASRLGDLLLR